MKEIRAYLRLQIYYSKQYCFFLNDFLKFIQRREIDCHKKLRDLVFVKFNVKLKNKLALKNKDPWAPNDDEEIVT